MTREVFHDREGRARTECYELVRFRDRVRMLTFVRRDGSRHSVSYAHLHGVGYTSRLLRIEFNTRTVVVEGIRLGIIHKALADHRVVYLREAPPNHRPDKAEAVISGIRFVETPST